MPDTKDFKSSFKLYLRLLALSKTLSQQDGFGFDFVWFCLRGPQLFLSYQLKPIIDGAFLKTDNPTLTFHRLIYWTLPITFFVAIMRLRSADDWDRIISIDIWGQAGCSKSSQWSL